MYAISEIIITEWPPIGLINSKFTYFLNAEHIVNAVQFVPLGNWQNMDFQQTLKPRFAVSIWVPSLCMISRLYSICCHINNMLTEHSVYYPYTDERCSFWMKAILGPVCGRDSGTHRPVGASDATTPAEPQERQRGQTSPQPLHSTLPLSGTPANILCSALLPMDSSEQLAHLFVKPNSGLYWLW